MLKPADDLVKVPLLGLAYRGAVLGSMYLMIEILDVVRRETLGSESHWASFHSRSRFVPKQHFTMYRISTNQLLSMYVHARTRTYTCIQQHVQRSTTLTKIFISYLQYSVLGCAVLPNSAAWKELLRKLSEGKSFHQ